MSYIIYSVGDKFIRITPKLKLKLVDLQKASTFRNKSAANSWKRAIQTKYPEAKIAEAELSLK